MLADDQIIELAGIDGILIYRDSELPDQFYYSGTEPRIAPAGDGYQLRLFRYDRPIAGQAGMLSFVVSLAPDPALLEKATDALRENTPAAQLVPIPFTSGSVVAAVIGGTPVASVPTLLGDNSAVFNIGLTLDQYLLLTRTLSDPQRLPVSVVYAMRYEAMRPQFAFSIAFDATRFRDWLQKKCKADILFISVEKVETFEDLRESGVIRVQSVNETGDPMPAGVARAFLQSFKSILTPMPQFAPPPEAGGDDSWGIGYSCSTVHDVQSIERKLDTDFKVRGAVARSAFFQSVLPDFGAALRAAPPIELATGESFTQSVTLRCYDSFNGAPVESLAVQIIPPAQTPSLIFDSRSGPERTVELVRDPLKQAAYRCSCEVHFNNDSRPRAQADVPIEPGQAFVDLQPAAFFTYRRYQISLADEFPWGLLRNVSISLSGPSGVTFTPGSLVLRKDSPEGFIEGFSPVPAALDDVEYQATYLAADGTGYEEQGFPSGTTIFLNPLRERQVRFTAAGDVDWQQCSQIVVVAEKRPGTFQLWRSGRNTLTKAAPRAPFTYWYAEDPRLSCRTMLVRPGGAQRGPAILSTDTVISVSDRETAPREGVQS